MQPFDSAFLLAGVYFYNVLANTAMETGGFWPETLCFQQSVPTPLQDAPRRYPKGFPPLRSQKHELRPASPVGSLGRGGRQQTCLFSFLLTIGSFLHPPKQALQCF